MIESVVRRAKKLALKRCIGGGEKGLVTEGSMLEFMHMHAAVVYQPGFSDRGFGGLNPYALGYAMMRDIKRICENPDDEDREWFPDIAGKPWLPTLHDAMRNYKDESFVGQFLSPRLMRELRLFAIHDEVVAVDVRFQRPNRDAPHAIVVLHHRRRFAEVAGHRDLARIRRAWRNGRRRGLKIP